MKAKFVGGKLNGMVLDVNEVVDRGLLKCRYFTEDLTVLRESGACVPRKELDNQPIFDGYLGPMWDGDKLRYETQEVYDVLSC